MTEVFFRELRNKSASRDDDSSGGKSKMARVLTQSTKPESSSGKRATASAELESGSKRVQRQRVLTNVSSRGIHLVDMSVMPSLLDTTVYSCRIALTIENRKPTRSHCYVLRHRSGAVSVSENVMRCLSLK